MAEYILHTNPVDNLCSNINKTNFKLLNQIQLDISSHLDVELIDIKKL